MHLTLSIRSIRPLLALVLALAIVGAACGGSGDDDGDGAGGTTAAENGERGAVTTGGDVSGSGENSRDDTDSDGGASGDDETEATPGTVNPAAEEILALTRAQATIYDWTRDEADCVGNNVADTGVALIGDLDNDLYVDVLVECNAIRGSLNFIMSLELDGPTSACVLDAMSDDEVADLGHAALGNATLEEGKAAIAAAAAAQPSCG
jgi:hypothetical protein